MRILLLNDYGVVVGGAEHATLALRNGLRARGHDVRVFASTAYTGGPFPDRHIPLRRQGLTAGVEFSTGRFADFYCYGNAERLQPLVMAANGSAYLRLRRVLEQFKPDIVHCEMLAWQLSPLVLPLLGSYPVVHHIQMYNPICPLGSKILKSGAMCTEPSGIACLRNSCFSPHAWAAVMLQRALWKRWSGVVDRMVAVSHCVKRRLDAEGARVDDMIWNGVPERPQGTMGEIPTISFAGRLVPEKGADLLIEAFSEVRAQVPNAMLLIAGDGPQRNELVRLAERFGEAVRFFGFLPREEMEKQIGSAWVHAVPGRWEEPFGLVTAEAMMRGAAVVATAIGGAVELIEDGVTGFLVEPNCPKALANALIGLLRDRGRAETIGRAARAQARRSYTEATMVDRFLRLYEELL